MFNREDSLLVRDWCNYDVRHSCFSDLVTKVADVKEKLNSTEHVLATSKEVEFRNKSQLTSFLKRGSKLLNALFDKGRAQFKCL